MARLPENAVQEALGSLPGWRYESGALVRDYQFPSFAAAFAFVTRLALLAEKSDHHPDIDIRYNKLRVTLISHDAGGVTDRDVAAAGAIGSL